MSQYTKDDIIQCAQPVDGFYKVIETKDDKVRVRWSKGGELEILTATLDRDIKSGKFIHKGLGVTRR